MVDNKDYSIHFEDDIMIVVYKCKTLSLDIAKNIIQDRIKLSNNQTQYIFVDARKMAHWPSKARDYMGKKENLRLIGPTAVLTQSPLMFNLITWFMSIFSVSSTIKFFKNDEAEQALIWLKEHIKKDLPIEEENK